MMSTALTSRNRPATGIVRVVLIAVALGGIAHSLPARAAAAPIPIDITASHGQFDNDTGVATYTGDVVMIRAKLRLKGAHLVIRRHDPKAPITAVLTGTPAHMRQDVTPKIKEVVHGTAHTITYSQAAGTITLTGNAIVHRGKDLLTAHQVVYHMANGQITAQAREGSKKRVHMILHPQGGGGG